MVARIVRISCATVIAFIVASPAWGDSREQLLDYVNNNTVLSPSVVDKLRKAAEKPVEIDKVTSAPILFESQNAEPAQTLKPEKNSRSGDKRGEIKKPQPAAGEKSAGNSQRRVTYRAKGKNWSVVSGYEGGKIFYERTKIVGGKKRTITLRYSPEERQKYDKIIAELNNRF